MLKLVSPIPAKHRNVPNHLIKTERPQTLGVLLLVALRALLATRVLALATARLLLFSSLPALTRCCCPSAGTLSSFLSISVGSQQCFNPQCGHSRQNSLLSAFHCANTVMFFLLLSVVPPYESAHRNTCESSSSWPPRSLCRASP